MKCIPTPIVVAAAVLGLALNATAATPAAPLDFKQVQPGVWKATVGTPEDLTLLDAAGAQPAREALATLPAASFPFHDGDSVGRHDGGRVALRFPLARDEEIYGLGVDFTSMRRTGLTYQLHVDHWGGRAGRTHAPVPFYVSTRGYGVFIDTSRYITVSVGLGVRLASADKPPVVDRTTQSKSWAALPRADAVEALVPAPGVDVYVFAGPTMLDAVRRYNLFCGGGALPPKWGLGFMTRTPTAYTAAQVLDEIASFRSRGIPLDMIGLEPGWHDHAYPTSFQWDPARFPDPDSFLSRLSALHVRANLWFNPYVSPTSSLYRALLPFAGSHLVWNGIVPDYSMPDARGIFQRHLRERVLGQAPAALGGFKIDEVDGIDAWLWPDLAEFPSGHDGEQMRQTYGLFLQRLVLEMYRGLNQRTLRAGARHQRRRLVVSVRHLQRQLRLRRIHHRRRQYGVRRRAVVARGEGRQGRGHAPPHPGGLLLAARAVQRVGDRHEALDARGGRRRHPRCDPAADAAAAVLVYRLRAVSLSGHAGRPTDAARRRIHATGRAGYERHHRCRGSEGPVPRWRRAARRADQARRTVAARRPARGAWFDFYTGRLAGEHETIEVAPPLSQIPLFVRDGGIIPMIGERQFAPGRDEVLPLDVRHYGTMPGEAMLYDDDGETFDYERGNHTWTRLSVQRDGAGQWRGSVTPDSNGQRWRYSDVRWTEMTR